MLRLIPFSGNFLIAFLTPFANDGIGYSFGFVFFGTNLTAALIVYFFLYESKSLSLENVDAMYSEPNLKAWKSDKWVPVGYFDRKTRDVDYWQQRPSVVNAPGYNPAINEVYEKDARSDEDKSEMPAKKSVHQENHGGERRV